MLCKQGTGYLSRFTHCTMSGSVHLAQNSICIEGKWGCDSTRSVVYSRDEYCISMEGRRVANGPVRTRDEDSAEVHPPD